MEFRCDRCATRYSTTQAVSDRQAYKYRCRLCGYTIFVRSAVTSQGLAPRAQIVHDVGRVGGVHAPGRARAAPEPARPSPLHHGGGSRPSPASVAPGERGPERLPSELFSGKSVIDPGDLPPPRDGYVDLRLDDEPPRVDGPGRGSAGAVTLPALTPVPVRREATPALPLPRQRAALRPADGPNRAARGDLTPTSPIPLARRPRGLKAMLGKAFGAAPRPPLRVTRRQRLLVAAAVFPVVTATAVALGVAFARGPEVPPPRKRPAATSLAQPAAPFGPGAPGTSPGVPAAAPAERPSTTSRPPAPPLAPPPVASPPRPGAASPPRVADEEPPRLAAARPARPEPRPARPEPRPPREPEAPPSGARALRVASAPTSRLQDEARDALVPAFARPAAARPDDRHASAGRAPEREEEPIVPRPGQRPPAALPAGCVEQNIRLPASFGDRLPGSVMLRFAVGRSGAPDLLQMQPGPDRLSSERVEPELGAALARAVRSCRFSPGTDEQGRPVRMWVVMKVQFAP